MYIYIYTHNMILRAEYSTSAMSPPVPGSPRVPRTPSRPVYEPQKCTSKGI